MNLHKYIRLIERKTNITKHHKEKHLSYFAKVNNINGKLSLEITDEKLVMKFPVVETDSNVVLLKMINTRNEFSKHIANEILKFQKKFWESGKAADIKPLTLKQFLLQFPFQNLDRSRLSRLISVLSIMTPDGKIICLRSLFISKKRYLANIIKEIIDESDEAITDKNVKAILQRKYGIQLSIRNICNCRKLLNIPNYKQRLGQYYGKDIRFSEYIKLTKGQYNRIPSECGVYELSSTEKINYVNYTSNILYIGSSKNIRKRLLCYTGTNGKNKFLKHFTNGSDIFIRYYLTKDYLHLEKHLLKNFKKTYGELPKTNKLGG